MQTLDEKCRRPQRDLPEAHSPWLQTGDLPAVR